MSFPFVRTHMKRPSVPQERSRNSIYIGRDINAHKIGTFSGLDMRNECKENTFTSESGTVLNHATAIYRDDQGRGYTLSPFVTDDCEELDMYVDRDLYGRSELKVIPKITSIDRTVTSEMRTILMNEREMSKSFDGGQSNGSQSANEIDGSEDIDACWSVDVESIPLPKGPRIRFCSFITDPKKSICEEDHSGALLMAEKLTSGSNRRIDLL